MASRCHSYWSSKTNGIWGDFWRPDAIRIGAQRRMASGGCKIAKSTLQKCYKVCKIAKSTLQKCYKVCTIAKSTFQKCYKVCKIAKSTLQKCCKVCKNAKLVVRGFEPYGFGVPKTPYVYHFFFDIALTMGSQRFFFRQNHLFLALTRRELKILWRPLA